MQSMDLNLLAALDHLVRTESVTAAAEAMNLSPSAMSRVLGRLRTLLGDPVLVRAGRRLVVTPRAAALKDRLHAWVTEATHLVNEHPAPTQARTFVVRATDALAGLIAADVVAALQQRSPLLRVRFVPEGDEDPEPLRDGRVDLDIGVGADDAPELITELLARERFVGVVRKGHPLTRGRVTSRRFVQYAHISVSRRGRAEGPIDRALQAEGLTRTVALVVPSFYAALMTAARSDLVAAVPSLLATSESLTAFALPVPTRPERLRQAWHPRSTSDEAHKWLRAAVKAAFGR